MAWNAASTPKFAQTIAPAASNGNAPASNLAAPCQVNAKTHVPATPTGTASSDNPAAVKQENVPRYARVNRRGSASSISFVAWRIIIVRASVSRQLNKRKEKTIGRGCRRRLIGISNKKKKKRKKKKKKKGSRRYKGWKIRRNCRNNNSWTN